MLQPLDLAVEFLDATKPDLVGIILSLLRPIDGPAPIELVDLDPSDPEGPLFRIVPWGEGYEVLPLTPSQCRAVRELVDVHQWAMAETGALR